MDKVLIVEDSKVIALGLRQWILQDIDIECDIAHSFAEAREMISQGGGDYFVSLLDLHLPDALEGEAVDFMLEHNVPPIVVTGSYDDKARKAMMAKDVVDFVVRQHPKDMGHLLKAIKRIYNNRSMKALVVDDSRSFRMHFKKILLNQRLQVFEAEDGMQALQVIRENPDIKLVLTDYHMPVMDGFRLVQEIRRRYSEDRMAVIVLSADDARDTSPMFLKVGANDYINKSATVEEFICRVNINLYILDLMHDIKESANRDYLTKIYNRKYFFEIARVEYVSAKAEERPLVIAMADIDHFKNVNDTYGHNAGDIVIKNLANQLAEHVRGFGLAARFGGEEFVALLSDVPEQGLEAFFEEFRKNIEDTVVTVGETDIRFTISMGVAKEFENSLQEMINKADDLLYDAKKGGRNQVRLPS